ncbi:hypothetical protein ABIA39_004369 [Nocardia sp. GAS34]|uniref:hypothetical protein n=1 Tax=unclassified Nocardia TaxID=2637762 RepID=UPI003D2349CA
MRWPPNSPPPPKTTSSREWGGCWADGRGHDEIALIGTALDSARIITTDAASLAAMDTDINDRLAWSPAYRSGLLQAGRS